MPHIYTPSIQASIRPLGPHPGAATGVPPTANTRLLASVGTGTKCCALGAPGAADSG